MPRVLSGIQPSGVPHLGNWIGAIARWSEGQDENRFFCVVDLHAITVPQDPAALRRNTVEMATWLMASGLDPDVCTLFVQSHVPEHTELAWILNCYSQMGELSRMVQFKDKSHGKESASVGLFTYPVLQAADILLYQADQVPVGEDQRQHIELARNVAQRFNNRMGETFTVPEGVMPPVGARIMDLQNVEDKMSKSGDGDVGRINLDDTPKATAKKIMRAVTDSGSEVKATPEKAGVTNLLDLLSAVTGDDVPTLENRFEGKKYGDFKKAVADAVNDYLQPARDRQAELAADPAEVERLLAIGAEKARAVAAATVTTVKERVGFLPSR